MPINVLPATGLPAPGSGDDSVHVDIVDVGHGSCVVIRAGDSVAIIDTGPNAALLEYLRSEGIERIDTVVLSHADADHIQGLSALLSQKVPITRILWNTDSVKRSEIWHDLVFQLDEMHERGDILASEEASRGIVFEVGGSRVQVQILAPRVRLRRYGPGQRDHNGNPVTTNSVSVVVRVCVDGESLLLVPGDLDSVGFSHLTDHEQNDLKAKYLILPHHGGLMGSSAVTSTLIHDLVQAVEPEQVFVSNGRGRYTNPRADVLLAVRSAVPAIPISCTQLSAQCSPTPLKQPGYTGPYSTGWARGISCAATTRLSVGSGISAPLNRERHMNFVTAEVAAPACA